MNIQEVRYVIKEDTGMFAEERRERILSLLNEEKRVMVKDLAEKFQVSIDSIRRDLSIMEDHGLLKKPTVAQFHP